MKNSNASRDSDECGVSIRKKGRKMFFQNKNSSPSPCSSIPSYAPAGPVPTPGLENSPFKTTQPYGPKYKLLWTGITQGHVAESELDFSPSDYHSFAAQAQGKLLRVGILTFYLRGRQMRGRGDHNPSKGVTSKRTVWKRLSPTRVLFPARVRLMTRWSGRIW